MKHLPTRTAVAVAILLASTLVAGDALAAKDDLDAHLRLRGSRLAMALADPVRPTVYVTDGADNSVLFLDTEALEIEGSLIVGSAPTAMELSPDGSLLFVLLTGGSQIAVVDLETRSALPSIDVPDTPTALAVGANDRLYVSTRRSPVSIFDVSALPAVSAGTLSGDTLYISGRSADRTTLYTQRLSTGLTVTQWDISGDVPAVSQTADIASGPPRITPDPTDETFAISPISNFFESTRFPNEDGNVPFYRSSDMLKVGTINVEWSALALAISPVRDEAVLAHSRTVTNATTPVNRRHNRNRPDLHVFDTSTYVETDRLKLRDFVAREGLAYGPDGTLYLLLGRDPAKAIGVIFPEPCPTQPQDACLAPGVSSMLDLRPKRGQLSWTWTQTPSGAASPFGEPTSETDYHLCLYDETRGIARLESSIALPGGKRWSRTDLGFRFKKSSRSGSRKGSLRTGTDGTVEIAVRAKGVELPALPLSQEPAAVVQLINSNGACWEASYSSPAKKNSRNRFKAKSD